MTRGVVTGTLVCAAFIYACAPRAGHVEGNADAAPTATRKAVTRSPADTGITTTLDHTLDNGTVHFALVVTNHGDGTEVRFPNGQTHDIVVLDQRDREVWRWSNGRFFTQTLRTKQLRTGRSLRYAADWPDAEAGTYRVVATLMSETHGRSVETLMNVR